jgi:hypothetical protein
VRPSGLPVPLGVGPIAPTGGRPRKDDPVQAEHLALRREQVEVLELAGMSERTIARRLNISPSTAHADVVWVRQERRRRAGTLDLAYHRQVELERLEAVHNALSPAMSKGNINAARTVVRASESRRRLLGLDAPVRIEHVVDPVADLLNTADPEQVDLLLGRERGQIIDVYGEEASGDEDGE